MLSRRDLLRDGGASLAAVLAITSIGTGEAAADNAPTIRDLLPDPATTPVPNPPFPKGLNEHERQYLETFDELDFDVFTHADWARLGESHSPNVRVHWPDGHFTDGIDAHIADLAALFVWAPDTRILEHPLRVVTNELTAVTGVMRGTFTQPMPNGQGGFIAPTGLAYAINMATVGIWNRKRRYMDEEFLFWDNQTFYAQIGLG
jgi:hypothetical protein